ncbi:MAG TPA: Uma2 family endonuclease [Tepidisphaeraceae bacterium]|nr:Uma2 family endonuclease [Tepidisphaeraceae bacterium]
MTQLAERSNQPAPSEPTERRWTRREYYRLAEQGYFKGQRVELIEGRIIQMPPQGLPHTTGVELVDRAVRKAFLDGYRFRIQMPFRAADGSDPEPDVAIVKGDPRDPADGHPTSAALIVEVSDTTLCHDRRKARLYAISGVSECWILTLADSTLEVYQNPMPSAGAADLPYASIRQLRREDSLAPLAAPQGIIQVADLLP